MKKAVSLVLILLTGLCAFAQADNRTVQMADTMRSNGKIYVVVAVILTIFAGLIIYLVRIDRKITRLENNLNIKR